MLRTIYLIEGYTPGEVTDFKDFDAYSLTRLSNYGCVVIKSTRDDLNQLSNGDFIRIKTQTGSKGYHVVDNFAGSPVTKSYTNADNLRITEVIKSTATRSEAETNSATLHLFNPNVHSDVCIEDGDDACQYFLTYGTDHLVKIKDAFWIRTGEVIVIGEDRYYVGAIQEGWPSKVVGFVDDWQIDDFQCYRDPIGFCSHEDFLALEDDPEPLPSRSNPLVRELSREEVEQEPHEGINLEKKYYEQEVPVENNKVKEQTKTTKGMKINFAEKLKALYMPEKVTGAGISLCGKICVRNNQGEWIHIDEENKLTSFIDVMVMEVPMFAFCKPVAQLHVGDIICTDNGYGRVYKADGTKVSYTGYDGHNHNVNVTTIALLNGAFVKTLLTPDMAGFGGCQNGFNPMMLALLGDEGEGGKLEELLPFMLMTQQGGCQAQPGAFNPMMLMLLAGKGGNGNVLETMAMMQMMQGQPLVPQAPVQVSQKKAPKVPATPSAK